MGTVVITGAGQGLGRADAVRLAADGWDVVSMTAVGRPADERPQRERRDVVRLQSDPLVG